MVGVVRGHVKRPQQPGGHPGPEGWLRAGLGQNQQPAVLARVAGCEGGVGAPGGLWRGVGRAPRAV